MSVTIRPAIFMGFPNNANLDVSEYLKIRGIDLLRAQPSDLGMYSLRDFVQIGYDEYAAVLPAFMRSMCKSETMKLTELGFPIAYPARRVLPFDPPPVLLSFRVQVAQEVLDNIRGVDSWEVRDYKSGKASGLEVKGYKWTEIAAVLAYKSNKTAPVTDEIVNPSTLPYALMLNKIASCYIAMQDYPAVTDSSHYDNLSDLFEFRNREMAPAAMQVDDSNREEDEIPAETEVRIFGEKMKRPQYKKGFAVRYKGAWEDDGETLEMPYWDDLDKIPKDDGLFFPYVSELANYDNKQVISVVERYFLGCLGDEVETIIEVFEKLKGEWGVLSSTQFGKSLTHLFTVIGLSVTAQARVIPLFEGVVYKGAVLSGGGFTVVRGESSYRPQVSDLVRGAIRDIGSNVSILNRMLNITTLKKAGYADALAGMKSMGSVRNQFIMLKLSAEERDQVIGLAKQLSFNESTLAINPESFARVAAYAADDDKDLEELPIHHSQIFSTNRLHVAWSAFGSMAPTFRLPSGTPLSLEKSWAGRSVTREGGTVEVTGNVTRISCNVVILKKALEDLDMMVSRKEVLNPLAKSGAKRSQFNQSRFFANKDFTSVVQSLRHICKAVVVDSSSKRKGRESEDDEAGPSNKRRGALSLD
jgi:hypothetical protein